MKRWEKILWGTLIGGLLFACGFFLNGYLHPASTPAAPQISETPFARVSVDSVVSADPVAATSVAVVAAAPTAQPADSNVIVYITKSGSKYHSAGCEYLSKSCIPITLTEAKAKGYTPCSKCDPPK